MSHNWRKSATPLCQHQMATKSVATRQTYPWSLHRYPPLFCLLQMATKSVAIRQKHPWRLYHYRQMARKSMTIRIAYRWSLRQHNYLRFFWLQKSRESVTTPTVYPKIRHRSSCSHSLTSIRRQLLVELRENCSNCTTNSQELWFDDNMDHLQNYLSSL